MKKFFAILTIIFSLANPIFAFGDFDSAVEDAHKDSKKETPKKSPKKPSSSTDSSKSSYGNDGSTSELIVTILEAIPMIWLINASTKYSPYPYSTDECNYLKYESSSDQLRKYRLSLDSSYNYLKELGYGNTSSIDCMIFRLSAFMRRTRFFLTARTKIQKTTWEIFASRGKLRFSRQILSVCTFGQAGEDGTVRQLHT